MPGTEGSGEVGGERSLVPVPIDIDRPRWDQSQFTGRLQYFARITNPLLIFRRSSEFEAAASLVGRARWDNGSSIVYVVNGRGVGVSKTWA